MISFLTAVFYAVGIAGGLVALVQAVRHGSKIKTAWTQAKWLMWVGRMQEKWTNWRAKRKYRREHESQFRGDGRGRF